MGQKEKSARKIAKRKAEKRCVTCGREKTPNWPRSFYMVCHPCRERPKIRALRKKLAKALGLDEGVDKGVE